MVLSPLLIRPQPKANPAIPRPPLQVKRSNEYTDGNLIPRNTMQSKGSFMCTVVLSAQTLTLRVCRYNSVASCARWTGQDCAGLATANSTDWMKFFEMVSTDK